MDNRRKNSRVVFRATVSLDFAGRQHAECETQDLSLKGVRVLGVTGHQAGEQCRVSLSLVGSTSHLALHMRGEVVRVDRDGIALHFVEMDPDSFFHLKNILYYNSQDPDRLDTEFSG
ncbi:MAG: PilZ domain-containing protein [Thermodesulfobacteriota bacterium]